MRRTRVKLLLALGSAIAVTAVVFGSANGSSTSVAAPAQGSIDSAVAATPKAGKAVVVARQDARLRYSASAWHRSAT